MKIDYALQARVLRARKQQETFTKKKATGQITKADRMASIQKTSHTFEVFGNK